MSADDLILKNETENDVTGKINAVSAYSGMNEVFAETRKIITEMQDGERTSVKGLADRIASRIKNMSNGHVLNLVQMFLKECKDVTVEVGRGGGVYKGGKPKRTDNRPRCPTCRQIIKHDALKKSLKDDALTTAII